MTSFFTDVSCVGLRVLSGALRLEIGGDNPVIGYAKWTSTD